MRAAARGLTLVELVIIIVVTGIIALITPSLLLHGVRVFVFLPNALVVNQAAAEVMHQIVEGGFSDVTITGQSLVRGLRFAVRRSTSEPAIWLAGDDCIGVRTSDGQSVVMLWDPVANQEVIRRRLSAPACPTSCLPNGTEEAIPYHAPGSVRILRIAPATPVFRYYNQSETLVAAPGCSLSGITTIRQVEIAFVAQTGSGVFDEGQAREQVTTSVAIRVP